MDEPTRATSPEDFGPASTIITLPVPGPGGRELRAEIQAASMEELLPLQGALPGAGADEAEFKRLVSELGNVEAQLEILRRHRKAVRPIIERYVLSPKISFEGPREGWVAWEAIHLRNQIALTSAISLATSAGPEAALATFHAVERGGGSDRGGIAGAVPNGAPAARVVPGAPGEVPAGSAGV